RSFYTYKDLLELFDATTKHHRQRTAMRQLPPVDKHGNLDGEPLRYTYGDLQAMATRGGQALAARGVTPGDKAMLGSENRPEWGITYFAALKAGATCVPVDANITAEELVNLLKSSRAKVAVISARSLARLEREHGPHGEWLEVPRLDFDDLLYSDGRAI